MAASGCATWHADVSMTASRGWLVLTSAWALADQRVNGVHVSASRSHRQVGPTGQCCVVKRKRKRERGVNGLKVELGLLWSWAAWTGSGPPLLLLFSFSSFLLLFG